MLDDHYASQIAGHAMTHQMTLEYTDEFLTSLGWESDEFQGQAKFLLAAKLFELGRLTSGQAAEFCGRGRVAFLNELSQTGIPACNLTGSDLEDELRFANV